MMDDNTIMTWGVYKGTRLGDTPAWYLLGLLQSPYLDSDLEKYIIDNESSLIADNSKNDMRNNFTGE